MPDNRERLLNDLSKSPNLINEAIEKRQASLGETLSKAERELYFLLIAGLVEKLKYGKDGKLRRIAKNFAAISAIDSIFDTLADKQGSDIVKDFVRDLLAVAAMTAVMYEGDADESELNGITDANALILAALGATVAGEVVKGGLLWEIWRANQVRQDLKNVVLAAVQSEMTLADLTKTVREFAMGTGEGGALTGFWRTYAYDLFNQVAELKNEQFRAELDLHWFIYVGDIIVTSRDFCIPKAGKVFADVEADTEWPKDPDLPGKTSGIPYVPRIDRGRWNCRHRIRYITREVAVQLDKKKVEKIEAKYGQT